MLNSLKQKITDYFVNNGAIPNCGHSLQRLQRLHYTPSVIYDIGAYKGDFAKQCLAIWPQTPVFCFEPLTERYEQLDAWSKTEKRITALNLLIGNENRDGVIFNESETASSVLTEHVSKDFITSTKVMRTLDFCIEENRLPVPALLKIDTQGYEYQVIEGILKHLDKVEVIISELNHIDLHKDVKIAEDVIQLMYQHGFVIYDVAEIHRRPFDNALWQTDFIFIKKNSFLRADKRWK